MLEENQSTKKYLFLFTISPVQSFIAQARKTQDLYAGSQILSELVKEAIRTTLSYNGKVIFPFVENKEELDNMQSSPNRFIAEIDCEAIDKDKIENLATVGETIEKNTKNKFLSIAETIFTDTLGLDKEGVDKKRWKAYNKQIIQHLDINWVFTPFTKENYHKKFENIEQILGAVKNVRTFEQNKELGRKCSIDGERNVLFCARGSRNKLQIKPNWKNLDEREEEIVKDFNSTIKEIYKGNLTQFEGVSAVSVLKRLYKEDIDTFKKFPSTAQIALLDDIENLDSKEQDILDCYINLFKKDKLALTCVNMFNKKLIEGVSIDNLSKNENWQHHFDYQLLFEENLTDNNITNSQQLSLLKSLFSKIQNKLKTRYYAVISFDVDSMGKWLSGTEIKDQQKLRNFHEVLSKKLILFAKKAKELLDNTKGKTIYAGGDDFLGFVNIKFLFFAMKSLRTLFDEVVNCNEVISYIKDSKKISFSAGVVIAHYKMPLGNVLEWAKNMEHEAKDFNLDEDIKDCFAIAVLKKSGEVIQTSSKWKDSNGNYLTTNISALYNELEKGKNKENLEGFSSTFIKSINRELYLFDSYQDRSDVNVDLKNILDCEMPRLMKRSCLINDKESKNKSVKELYEVLDNFYWSNSAMASKAMPNFLNMLSVSDFLTRKINQD
ncbi:CRISPR-associated protein, Cmr2 family [Bernardetia litoralis DSM 6794]|uniref:CRISPR-associated protein, Cmr2 family n=1 Tax=Bernardetia litoralis (strain ATCC 23117 / DSM 6794 / NBRC 15988 / NCIMB 1366 / Fx l1 / Sio-4) TaxID=880071 RepID=I4AP51_BERLS|nr:type III-B CRISPR-associated protein Cas10/Cmr2 [Bernardetia litoralis]AFM05736.1 CRISPR-associated protein, Cmr2 family [Bernardetia litoralis DSM 6794]